MNIQVTIAIIGVAAALLGSAVGAISSYFSTRSMRKLEWKLSQIEKEIEKRENLYAEFLSEANKAIISAFNKKGDVLSELSQLVNLESKIRLLSPSLGDLAREITACALDHHEKDKKVVREYPKLRDTFINDCRAVLDKLRANV